MKFALLALFGAAPCFASLFTVTSSTYQMPCSKTSETTLVSCSSYSGGSGAQSSIFLFPPSGGLGAQLGISISLSTSCNWMAIDCGAGASAAFQTGVTINTGLPSGTQVLLEIETWQSALFGFGGSTHIDLTNMGFLGGPFPLYVYTVGSTFDMAISLSAGCSECGFTPPPEQSEFVFRSIRDLQGNVLSTNVGVSLVTTPEPSAWLLAAMPLLLLLQRMRAQGKSDV